MFRDVALKVDHMPLKADHTLARAHGGTQADQLLLTTCNPSRGATVRTTTKPRRYWSREW